MTPAEITAALAPFDLFEEVGSVDDFEFARDVGHDAYAAEIVAQCQQRGALTAVCTDIASTLGGASYDDAVLVAEAVIDHWEHIANLLPFNDRDTLRLRIAIRRARHELADEIATDEMLNDLIALCRLHLALRQHAFCVNDDDGPDGGENYIAANQDEIVHDLSLFAVYTSELIIRDEIDFALFMAPAAM